MAQSSDERDIRINKLDTIREQGINPYLDRCDRTCTLKEASDLAVDTKEVELRGRLMLKRVFGKLMFAHIQDWTGRFQIALNRGDIDQSLFKFFQKLVDVGDFIWVTGTIFRTERGELTLNVLDFKLLSKAIRPLPEKYHGVTDLETRSRQRYLDILMDEESRDRFKKRIQLTTIIRNYLNAHDFLEVETPTLQAKPSGAMAKPFKTRHNALDIDLFMRIAPETYLKRCIAGGFERVYEFARCFRNEGMDPSHLQEFTLLEFYAAYWNYEDNMLFTEQMIKNLLQELNGSLLIDYQGTKIDFSGEWPRYSLQELILQHADIDIRKVTTKDALVKAIKEKKIQLEGVDFKTIGYGNLLDQLYKKVARPGMIQPQFLIHHPIDISPLARRNDENPGITDRFQLVVNTWEVVNAYSELVDPLDQRERLLKQAEDRKKGDDEAMIMEEDFILCMEYGMPPISGWGMGIDRFVALLTNQENLREVVLFPLMRPSVAGGLESSDTDSNNTDAASDEREVLPPVDIDDLGVDYNELDQLFSEKITSAGMKNHSISSAAVLRGVARRFKLNEKNFYYLGLVHDIDFDIVPEMEKHATVGSGWLADLGMTEEALHAIRSHNSEGTGIKRETFLDYALLCSESITGLISATAKIYPDKKVASVKVKSITKRMKDKAFAAKVNRDYIRACERIGLPLAEFIEIAINSMKEVADQIGL
jgi:lysyl-tRNA synthetase class 2